MSVATSCAVVGCQRPGVERHHFAPKAYFFGAADLWPTAMLCAFHHAEWHRRVTPDLWQMRERYLAEERARRRAKAERRVDYLDVDGI